MFGKSKVAMLVAELVGTIILTMVVLSVRSSGIGYSFFVALGAGLTIGGLTLAVGATSGAHFNPALTFGLWVTRKVKTAPAIVYIAMQILGGACAYWLYTYLVKNHLQNMAGHFSWRVFLAEAIGTFIFVWGWAAAAARKFTGLQFAAAAGAAFAVAIIVSSLGSAGVDNPAIALGIRSWGWGTYVAGPAAGALVAALVQTYLFTGTEVAETTVATSATRATVAATSTTARSTKSTTATKKKSTSRKKK